MTWKTAVASTAHGRLPALDGDALQQDEPARPITFFNFASRRKFLSKSSHIT